MTREVAVEYARRGIRANALCPGPVDTPLLAQLLAESGGARAAPRARADGPPGEGRARWRARRSSSPRDESAYVNGATFLVDGGITAAYVTAE